MDASFSHHGGLILRAPCICTAVHCNALLWTRLCGVHNIHYSELHLHCTALNWIMHCKPTWWYSAWCSFSLSPITRFSLLTGFCPYNGIPLASVQDLKRSCKNLHKKRLDTSLVGHYSKYAKHIWMLTTTMMMIILWFAALMFVIASVALQVDEHTRPRASITNS